MRWVSTMMTKRNTHSLYTFVNLTPFFACVRTTTPPARHRKEKNPLVMPFRCPAPRVAVQAS
jgi:hypothetical protein